ncbi:hypothetical protein NUM_02160 [Actinocatenispora comari]|uniref:Uncharacterized protein n=1 Tax=Actinocatenispora comari TaxID=2807577 RepID=A0A8J4A4Z3_9ACTN|nr:hypothetical protein NUM_02160 [Actinocatenispora comari]
MLCQYVRVRVRRSDETTALVTETPLCWARMLDGGLSPKGGGVGVDRGMPLCAEPRLGCAARDLLGRALGPGDREPAVGVALAETSVLASDAGRAASVPC